MEQILKKEDKLKYKGGFFRNASGSLVLTNNVLYFETKRGKKVFDIPLKSIQSVNCKKGVGMGVEHMYVIYQENGKEKKVKIEHYAFVSAMTIGNLSRLSMYFSSWEQTINDARFGRSTAASGGLDNLEKLAELKQKGILTEEEFQAKKKQLLAL